MSAGKRHDYNFRAFLQRVVGLINVYLLLSLPPRLLKRILWETLRIEPEALIDLIAGTERRPDFIVSVEVLNEDGTRMRIYILIEHKSHPDSKVALQVASYEIRLLEKTRSPVYSVVVFTGNKAFLVPTIWESALGAKAGKIAPFPQHNHRPRVMMLKDISDIRILKYKLGIFVYVAKHIDDFHDDDKVITVLKYCHRLLRDGLDLEVTWLLG